jgi:hypothetical protein
MPTQTIPYLGIFIIILVGSGEAAQAKKLLAPIQELEARPQVRPAEQEPAVNPRERASLSGNGCLPEPIEIELPQRQPQRQRQVLDRGGKRCNRSRKRRKITHKQNYRRSDKIRSVRNKSRVKRISGRNKSRVQRKRKKESKINF